MLKKKEFDPDDYIGKRWYIKTGTGSELKDVKVIGMTSFVLNVDEFTGRKIDETVRRHYFLRDVIFVEKHFLSKSLKERSETNI